MDWLRLSQHSRVTSSGEGGENMGANCAAKTLAVARCVSAWLHLKLKTLIPKRQADLKGNHKLPKKASCAFRSFVVDGFVLTHTRLKLATCKQWYYSTECVYYMIIYIYTYYVYEFRLYLVLVHMTISGHRHWCLKGWIVPVDQELSDCWTIIDTLIRSDSWFKPVSQFEQWQCVMR